MYQRSDRTHMSYSALLDGLDGQTAIKELTAVTGYFIVKIIYWKPKK